MGGANFFKLTFLFLIVTTTIILWGEDSSEGEEGEKGGERVGPSPMLLDSMGTLDLELNWHTCNR